MGLEISKLTNTALRKAANSADENKNGRIDDSELFNFSDKAIGLVKNKQCSETEYKEALGLFFSKSEIPVKVSQPGDPSVAKKTGLVDAWFGLTKREQSYYEFKTNDGNTKKVVISDGYCYAHQYKTFFDALIKYSTKDDPNITAQEFQGIIKELSKYSDIGKGNGMDSPKYDIAKENIIKLMNISMLENSDGGKDITVKEQQDLLEAWCTTASYNVRDISDKTIYGLK